MNRNLIFAFILFTTFTVVNSLPHQFDKRLDWGTCYTNKGTFPKIDVTTSPDPIEGQICQFTASGNLPQDINSNDQLYIIFIDDDNTNNVYTFSTPSCGANGLPQCPIKAGTSFSVSISVQVPQFPEAFDIYAVIGNPPDETLGCAYTDLWPNPPISYPITK